MAIDYGKTREEAAQRKQALLDREKEIVTQRKCLDEEERQIKQELIGLDQVIEGVDVATSAAIPDPETPGLTDHIRDILQKSTVHLLPTQIRDSCLAVGIKGSSMKNLLISVHNVLARLEPMLDKADVEGKAAYKWKDRTVDVPYPRNTRSALLSALPSPGTVPRRTLLEQMKAPGEKEKK